MQRQKIIILIIGIVLSFISLGLVMSYIDQQVKSKDEERKRVVEQRLANQAAVLVTKQDIPKGTVIDENLFDTAIVPGEYVQPQAVTSLDRIAGMITVVAIAKNEQITMSKLSSAKEVRGSGSLSMATPIGKRAITISVDNISSVAGMVRPGDYVDVIATIPIPVQGADGKQSAQAAVVPLFQNVLVLAVGQETGTVSLEEAKRYKKEEKQESSPLITLALMPQEASLLAFVQEQGKIRLTLRSPSDAKIEQVQTASWDALFQYLTPRETLEARQKEEEEKIKNTKAQVDEGAYIEIYRGLNKEKIPLSNK